MLCGSFAISKEFTPDEELGRALSECRALFLTEFGEFFDLSRSSIPSLVLCAINEQKVVVGVAMLKYYEETRAFALQTISRCRPYTRAEVGNFLLHKEAPSAILRWFGPGQFWISKAIGQRDAADHGLLREMGFASDQHFMLSIFSPGYIPFDPLDQVLLKRPMLICDDDEAEAGIQRRNIWAFAATLLLLFLLFVLDFFLEKVRAGAKHHVGVFVAQPVVGAITVT